MFDCPICGTGKSVHIEVNRKIKVAIIRCGKCKVQATRPMRPIEERVDVYGDWLDELLMEENDNNNFTSSDDTVN